MYENLDKELKWEISDEIVKLAHELNAYEIISLESVGTPGAIGIEEEGEEQEKSKAKSFFYATHEDSKKKLKEAGAEPLQEGIIVGVTGTLLLKAKHRHTCIFAETHSQLPDSKAAAKIVEILNKYLGLQIDTKPLMESAKKFEQKLKKILEQGAQAQEAQQKKEGLSYLG